MLSEKWHQEKQAAGVLLWVWVSRQELGGQNILLLTTTGASAIAVRQQTKLLPGVSTPYQVFLPLFVGRFQCVWMQ